MNIIMLGHKRIPSREGGIEIVVEELAVRMVTEGHNVTCCNRGGHNVAGMEYEFDTGKKYKGVRLKTIPTIRRKGFAAVSSSFFGAIYAAFGRYDIVHIHAEGPAAFCWIPKLMGKKVVVTVHGLDWQRTKWKGGFASKYILFGEKAAVKWADEIIVLSRGTQNYFKKKYDRETQFIPNGVNKPEIYPIKELREKYRIEKDSYILYLGRLVPEKGVHYLIQAWEKVKSNKKLIIAGGSSDTEKYIDTLKKLAEGKESILFTGFVQGRLLGELYSNAYAYVLPSDLEGMPISLLEAMSYGNCCLVSNIPECVEVVEDKGVIFKKSDVNDLTKKLQCLLDASEEVEKYKSTAADYIRQKYDWAEVVKDTLLLYRNIIK